jgi:DNA-binding protein
MLRARGRAISRAVEVSQIVKGRFIGDVRIDSIRIDGEQVKAEDGRVLNLPVIEIVLARG